MFTITVRRVTIAAVLAVIVLFPAALVMLSFLGTKPSNLGARGGRLAVCPDKPNCVSTQSDDPRHAIDPIRFTGSADAALERLRRVLRQQARTEIISDHDHYIHAESRSRLFRFVDDLEFFVDESAGVIHFRSASRVGHSDFGVNRKRAEALRRAFERATRPTQTPA